MLKAGWVRYFCIALCGRDGVTQMSELAESAPIEYTDYCTVYDRNEFAMIAMHAMVLTGDGQLTKNLV